jgi:hypothetical protein
MRRVSIDLQIEQQIIYPDSQQVERYDHKTQAVLLELESFTKLTYQNLNQEPVEVKWLPQADGSTQIQVSQAQGILLFVPNQETMTNYQTPQGSWPLSVHTQHLYWHFEPADQLGKIRYALTIDYQLKNDQELLGNYRFRLIYVA